MERADWLDFDGMKTVRKPRTFSSRKPNSGGSHTSFLNEQYHSSASAYPPSDPRNVVNSDKGLNDETGEYLNSYSHGGDYKRRLGNSNRMGRFEKAKDDLGWIHKSGYKMVGGDDDSVPKRNEIKRVRREFADLNGKHLGRGSDGDRNYDREGFKSQDYEHSKSSEKSSREKSHRVGFHYDRDSKEHSNGEKVERERNRFSKTFKRKCNGDDLDQSKRSHECGMGGKGSFERHGSHEILEHDRDGDRDRDRDRDGSLDVQGSMKSSKGGHGLGHGHKPAAVVGLGAGGASGDWSNSDGHRVSERRALDFHNPSHVTGGMQFEYGRLLDGDWRAEGRTMDTPYVGHSKSASEGPNGVQVKTAIVGRTFDRRDPDLKALVKSVVRQDDLPSQGGWLTKAKVKVGGVTHTTHANSTVNTGGIKKGGVEGSSVSTKPTHATEGRRRRQRLILQENSDNEDDFPVRVEIQESPKEKTQVIISASIANMDIHPAKDYQNGQPVDGVTPGEQQAKLTNNAVANQPIRKSSRIPKKRTLDGEHYVDDDGELTLQHKSSRTMKKCVRNGEYDEDKEECERPQRRSSRIPKKRTLDAEYEEDDEAQQHKRTWKRSKYQIDSEQLYQEDAKEAAASGNEDVENTDVDFEGMKKRSKSKQEGDGDSTVDDKKDVPLTTRQRAMQSCKDTGSEVGANLIEFPEGLPQSSKRKRKEKLSEVEQQLQKTEAAQRRKIQLQKAESEAQVAAIKKILGKNTSRKKREDKLQKHRAAMAEKKAASAMLLASNSVRTVMRPSGTVVSFPENTGLPSIFNNPCRYPPPREKCAGPLCNNTYKYRDSKTHLPLCSLQCYRAIRDVEHPVSISNA